MVNYSHQAPKLSEKRLLHQVPNELLHTEQPEQDIEADNIVQLRS